MKFQAIVFLSVLSGAIGLKQVVYPLQDSTIFTEDDEVAKGVGVNVVSLTKGGIRRSLEYYDSEEMVATPVRRSLRKRRIQNNGDGNGDGGDGDSGDGEGGDGDGGDGVGGDGDGGDGIGGDGDGGDGDGGCPGDGEGGDGEGGDGDGGDGEGGDGEGGDGDAGDGEGGDGEGGDGEGGDGEGGDGDGGDGEGGDGDGEGGDGDGGDGEGGDGDGGDGEGGDGEGGDSNGGCDDGGGGGISLCFSGQNTVETMSQGSIRMDLLKIGDYVRVQGGKFARVYSFGHYEKNQSSNYLQIQAAGIKIPLEITKDHMVFILDGTTSKSVPASSIKVGDLLTTKNGASKVSKINNVQRSGAYAPFTTSGDIIVSGIVASNYISMIPEEEIGLPVTMQWIAHTFKAPHRLVCAISFDICKNETYTDGLSNWIYIPYYAGRWLARQNAAVKVFGSALLVTSMYLSPIMISVLAVGFLLTKLKKTKAKTL